MEVLKPVIDIARQAGVAIMEVYASSDAGTTFKENNSPLTLADTRAHFLILKALKNLTPDLPVLSEESADVPYEIRKTWKKYWLVDPLDGTKEFLKKNGEFTVNIALIENGEPVLGVVHAPAKNRTYYAEKGKGAFSMNGDNKAVAIHVDREAKAGLKVVISRSHLDKETEEFLKKLGPHESVTVGSSLKFCLVAEGTAHAYPRFWPSMEWDTAAAQCVVEEAGGTVRDLTAKNLTYNKQNLKNPFFIAGVSAALKK